MKPIILTLIAVARAAHQLADNTEERGPVNASEHVVDSADFKELCVHLDELDKLPDPPNEVATGPRKAEYCLLENNADNCPCCGKQGRSYNGYHVCNNQDCRVLEFTVNRQSPIANE